MKYHEAQLSPKLTGVNYRGNRSNLTKGDKA